MRVSSILIRFLCTLICLSFPLPWIVQAWGLAPMSRAIWPALPGAFALIFVAWSKRWPEVSRAVRVGFWAGVVGTLLADATRINGNGFIALQASGMWLWNSSQSTGFTDCLGWLYHCANGVAMAILYALWMPGRHWAWGLLWASGLELGWMISPLPGFFPAVSPVDHGSRLVFGLVVGGMVFAPNPWARVPGWARASLLLLGLAGLLSPAILRLPEDHQAPYGAWLIYRGQLTPRWVRRPCPAMVQIFNPGDQALTLMDTLTGQETPIPARSAATLSFQQPGVHPIKLKELPGARTGFALLEAPPTR